MLLASSILTQYQQTQQDTLFIILGSHEISRSRWKRTMQLREWVCVGFRYWVWNAWRQRSFLKESIRAKAAEAWQSEGARWYQPLKVSRLKRPVCLCGMVWREKGLWKPSSSGMESELILKAVHWNQKLYCLRRHQRYQQEWQSKEPEWPSKWPL